MKIGIIRGGGTGPELIDCTLTICKNIGISLNVKELNLKAENFNREEWNEQLFRKVKRFYMKCKKEERPILRGSIPAPVLYPVREATKLHIKINPIWPIYLPDNTYFTKEELKRFGKEVLLIRINTSGAYHSKTWETIGKTYQLISYQHKDIEKIIKIAFELTKEKNVNKVVHLSMKCAVQGKIGKIWKKKFEEIGKEYNQIEYGYFYPGIVDVIRRVKLFKKDIGTIIGPEDTIDVLQDDIPHLILGDLNLACSGNFPFEYFEGKTAFGIYQTVHGTQKPIANQNKANPIGMLHAFSMLLEWSYKMKKEAEAIRNAIRRTLHHGYRTPDIYRRIGTKIGTKEIVEKIIENFAF